MVAAGPMPTEGRTRVVFERLRPCVDDGRFPIKRVVGEDVVVEVDAFADGHDQIRCLLLWRPDANDEWFEVPMQPVGSDRWRASFRVIEVGTYRYSVRAFVDRYGTWVRDLARRPTGDDDLPVAYAQGARLVREAAANASAEAAARLRQVSAELDGLAPEPARRRLALADETLALMATHAPRRFVSEYHREFHVVVDRMRARFSSWYEFFPRSADGDRHGTLRDCEDMLAYVASMGFDIVYLPPIHPIGRRFRKGPNNMLAGAADDDVGSPWAIGASEGGHKAVHPALGTLDDFRRVVRRAKELGIEVALDIAFQCAPDHPYVAEHPAWFRRRPDGSVQYAENPPKKYQDIYPFDFETEDWRALWAELKSVFTFWIDQGVNAFRVDNPHTKPFAFWEWVLGEIRREHPHVLFLSEAFTRPRVMHRLAKLGFTQSYTYFTWRNTRRELTRYFTELAQGESREYFRPNVWPNTPDILNEYLQYGGRPAFVTRLVLAATLSANYGIYGPAFELQEHRAREPGSEEYLDSEKYQLRTWDLDRPDSLRDLITRINRIRREHPALQSDWSLRFHDVDNDRLICYSKTTTDGTDRILVIVNLDPHHRQTGWVTLPTELTGVDDGQPYQVHDLLTGARYIWYGARNYVELDPQSSPAHVFRIRTHVRSEHDFDYYT